MGFCRKKDITSLTKTNKFYFHAIEQNKFVQDFPTEIFDSKIIYLYGGGRGKPLIFTGHYGKILRIKLKHKSQIRGKEKSRTEYYYEIELDSNFEFNNLLTAELEPKILFSKNDKINQELIIKYLPAITELDKVELNNKQTKNNKQKIL